MNFLKNKVDDIVDYILTDWYGMNLSEEYEDNDEIIINCDEDIIFDILNSDFEEDFNFDMVYIV